MHAALVYHVDHPIDRVGFAKPPYGLFRRVEGWLLSAVGMRTCSSHLWLAIGKWIFNHFMSSKRRFHRPNERLYSPNDFESMTERLVA
jgi:hypothetical protein